MRNSEINFGDYPFLDESGKVGLFNIASSSGDIPSFAAKLKKRMEDTLGPVTRETLFRAADNLALEMDEQRLDERINQFIDDNAWFFNYPEGRDREMAFRHLKDLFSKEIEVSYTPTAKDFATWIDALANGVDNSFYDEIFDSYHEYPYADCQKAAGVEFENRAARTLDDLKRDMENRIEDHWDKDFKDDNELRLDFVTRCGEADLIPDFSINLENRSVDAIIFLRTENMSLLRNAESTNALLACASGGTFPQEGMRENTLVGLAHLGGKDMSYLLSRNSLAQKAAGAGYELPCFAVRFKVDSESARFLVKRVFVAGAELDLCDFNGEHQRLCSVNIALSSEIIEIINMDDGRIIVPCGKNREKSSPGTTYPIPSAWEPAPEAFIDPDCGNPFSQKASAAEWQMFQNAWKDKFCQKRKPISLR